MEQKLINLSYKNHELLLLKKRGIKILKRVLVLNMVYI